MGETRRPSGLIGLYDEPGELLAAARVVRDAGYSRWDCHTPYPVHGLDDAMGLRESPLAMYALCAGAIGAALGLLFQWWTSAVAYPIRIGGKPPASWPSFVPITFELFVLFSAVATALLLVLFCRLWRWHSPLHDSGVMAEVTSRRFALVLMADDPKFDEAGARELLATARCSDVRPLWDSEAS